jgi:cobalt-zinc-cadmium efflux system membrane fusion protein
MSLRWKSILRWVAVLAIAAAAVGVAVVVGPQVKNRFWPPRAEPSVAEGSVDSTELVSGQPGTIRLAPGVAYRLGVQTAEVRKANKPVTVELPGTLSFDADRLSHVHARFAGEVVEIGVVQGGSRPLDFGASVQKGQLLAVIWSRELGEKKSELVDALSQLHVDQASLNRLTQASVEGAIPEHVVRDAQRKVESDQIAVGRTVRTLQSWRVPPEEIDALRAEAESLRHDAKPIAEEHVQRWARAEVRAPLDGAILEKNIAVGDLVDTSLDLFKIADLSRLRVMAHVYEEQLPLLDNRAESQRQWTISVQSDKGLPPLAGKFEQIGKVIDPNEHAALITGWVDNRAGHLRAGQFITARVELPVPEGEVAIPASALVEEGQRQFVFVQPNAAKSEYVRRAIAVSRRDGKTVFVWSAPTAAQRRGDAQALRAGERVVRAGVVQLAEAMRGLEAAAPRAEAP